MTATFMAFFLEEKVENRKDFFDRHASTWDRDLRYEGKSFQLLEVAKSFGLSEGDSVLDVGTGTGVLLPFLRQAIGPRGTLIGIDFSFKMLERAKIRQFPGEKNLINGSVEAIPFRSGRFDRVTCFSAFPHFPNKSKALFEMVRVLRTGGTLSIAHVYSVEEINQFHLAVGGPVSHDFLPHPERIKSLMEDSGLDEVSIVNQPGKFFAQGKKI
jgi:ubiquinone/menaquinone biosynthesis C-methylase UbiE